MAEDSVVHVSFDGKLEPASPSLQNCIKFSNSGRYFSALCDFGAVSICQLTEVGEDFKVVLVKRLAFDKGELLEGHAWSSDDQIFAVAGCKIYLFKVCQGFTSLYTIALYYMPKDISVILTDFSSLHKVQVYSLAVAGPNGVELYQMEIADNFKMGGSSSLHSDLAIALVEFSPDQHYLAVAALDGHFGIWTISSLDTDQKEFWYVHVKTVRITSMEFSPDSTMVAVADWEGSWHLYRKIVQNERVTWEEFHHNASVDRVSGDLPGSFISWSPENRFVRLTQCSDKTSCLSTFDTQTSVATGIPLDGVVKGIASFRRMSGDYTLCVLRSKQCCVVKWPTSESAAPVKANAAHEEETKLLFQESLEGSLLVERSVAGGVILQWRRAPQDILVLLRKISKKGSEINEYYQPSKMQQCSVRETISKNNQRDKEESESVQCNQDEIFRTEFLQQDNGHVKSLTDCRQGNNSQHFVKPSEGSSKNTELSNDRSKVGENGKTTEHRSLKEAEGDTPGMSVELHAVGSTENTSKNVRQAGNVLTTSEENTCGSVYSYADGSFTKRRCTKSNEQSNATCTPGPSNEQSNGTCTPRPSNEQSHATCAPGPSNEQSNVTCTPRPSNEQSNATCAPRPSNEQSNATCTPRPSNEQSNATCTPRPSNEQSNGTCTPRPSNEQSNATCTPRPSNEVVLIEAPFLNPRLFQKSGTNSLSPSLTSTVKLLITTNYVIVAILPLLAYVYYHEKEEWQSLLFPVAVKSCCIAQGKYLVLLTNEGGLRIWCLPSMKMLYSSHEVLCATDKGAFERYTMTGHLFEPQFSIVKLDKAGAGEVLRVSFQPNLSDFSLSVTRLLVCYPGLLSVSCCTSRVCGSVGHLIIFKQRQDSEDGDETSQEYKDLLLVKWVVIIPELCICSSFLEEPNCSLEQFIICHHEALGQLDTLTIATL